jgi:hypothetical protein
MFLLNSENPKNLKFLSLSRRLMMEGIKQINFNHVTYFALALAAQMIVLEFDGNYQYLEKLLIFFLFKFLPFYVIQSLKLKFKFLFDKFENPFKSSISENGIYLNEESIFDYRLHSELDIKNILGEINLKMIELINQITFCRSELTQILLNLLVISPAQDKNPPSKEDLKKRYFKIEVIKNMDFLDSLIKVSLNRGQKIKLVNYNDLSGLNKYLVGNQFFKTFRVM